MSERQPKEGAGGRGLRTGAADRVRRDEPRKPEQSDPDLEVQEDGPSEQEQRATNGERDQRMQHAVQAARRTAEERASQREQPARVAPSDIVRSPDERRADESAEVANRVDERDAGGRGGPAKELRWHRPEHADERPLRHLRHRKARDEQPESALRGDREQKAGR